VNKHHQNAMTAVMVYDDEDEDEIKAILENFLNINFRFPKLCLTKYALFK
jgi:RNA binding exosome subunit